MEPVVYPHVLTNPENDSLGIYSSRRAAGIKHLVWLHSLPRRNVRNKDTSLVDNGLPNKVMFCRNPAKTPKNDSGWLLVSYSQTQ
jgi:hypothetical protein